MASKLGLGVWTIWAKAGLEVIWSRWQKPQEDTYSCLAPVQSHSLLGLAGQDLVSPGSWSETNRWDPAPPGRHSPVPTGPALRELGVHWFLKQRILILRAAAVTSAPCS